MITNETEVKWKEGVIGYCKVPSQNFITGPEKNHEIKYHAGVVESISMTLRGNFVNCIYKMYTM
jgi:hypothetical protein